MLIFTFLGSNVFLLPAYILLILYFFFIRKNTRMALDTAMIGLTRTGLLFLMKDIFRRHRPPDPLINNVTGYSFPSGHSFSAFTFSGLVIYIIWETKIHRRWKMDIIYILLFICNVCCYQQGIPACTLCQCCSRRILSEYDVVDYFTFTAAKNKPLRTSPKGRLLIFFYISSHLNPSKERL